MEGMDDWSVEDAIIETPDADAVAAPADTSSATGILKSYADGEIKFDELVAQLVAFPWKPVTPSEDVWGVLDDWEALGQPGTVEEIAVAQADGWITSKERLAINKALYQGSADGADEGNEVPDVPPDPATDEVAAEA